MLKIPGKSRIDAIRARIDALMSKAKGQHLGGAEYNELQGLLYQQYKLNKQRRQGLKERFLKNMGWTK